MFLILLVFGILVVFVFDVNCVFKTITGIPCPGCGLTRGFRMLFKGHLLSAEKYNIVPIPIFLLFVCCLVLMIIDFFKKTNKTKKYLSEIANHYILIIGIVLATWIVNIIRGI